MSESNKKTVARFRVALHLGKVKVATIEINRSNLMVSVRPLHGRETFDMHLSDVVEMIMWRVAKSQALAVKAAKPKRRRTRVQRGLVFKEH